MKLSLTLLATASYGAPQREKLTNDRSAWSTTPVPCSKAVSNSVGVFGGSPFKSVDNGQSGQVTFESYTSWTNCFVDIGSSCDASGVQVEITHMELETFTDYDAYYEAYNETYKGTRCYDTIHFEWVNKDGETVEDTDPQCGCLGEDHLSCDEHPFYDDYFMMVTKSPIE